MAKKRSAKILHIINDLGVGGAQRVVTDLVTHLDPSRFEPIVFNLNFAKGKSIQQALKIAMVAAFVLFIIAIIMGKV